MHPTLKCNIISEMVRQTDLCSHELVFNQQEENNCKTQIMLISQRLGWKPQQTRALQDLPPKPNVALPRRPPQRSSGRRKPTYGSHPTATIVTTKGEEQRRRRGVGRRAQQIRPGGAGRSTREASSTVRSSPSPLSSSLPLAAWVSKEDDVALHCIALLWELHLSLLVPCCVEICVLDKMPSTS